jgi:hypothetical protein
LPIDFDLAGAHPDFRRDIPAILLPLSRRYPGAKLSAVHLYDPEDGDTSMGATYEDGEIRLNKFWFGRDPRHLTDAARDHPFVRVGDAPMGWHGAMLCEPPQIIFHEFGHCVWNGLPRERVEGWATERWRAATRRPYLAPSGYALASPPEFFGEMFALCEMGLATGDEVSDLAELTRGVR